jgi:hypothetical protein
MDAQSGLDQDMSAKALTKREVVGTLLSPHLYQDKFPFQGFSIWPFFPKA